MLRIFSVLVALTVLAGCATTPPANPRHDPSLADYTYLKKAEQCVPYARRVSGVEIFGDAHTWWDRSVPRYQRGGIPQEGAVLVLSKTKKMTHGHVAVVKDVIDSRQINVTHSNWGNDTKSRRALYHSMRVQDISPNNDWTNLRFWNDIDGVFGFPYKARGFIYPHAAPVAQPQLAESGL
jgi:hypothetical protein